MKRRLIFVLVMLLGMGGLYGVSLTKAEDPARENGTVNKDTAKEWGRYQRSTGRSGATKEIYLEGKNAVITMEDYERTVYFFTLQGMGEKQAKEQAEIYVKESAALEEEARRQGYTVSEKEIEEKIRELQNMEELDETSRKMLEDVIEGYGGEEEYWKYQKKVYEKLLPVEKMAADLMQKFQEDPQGDGSFQEWYERYKKELVKKEFS